MSQEWPKQFDKSKEKEQNISETEKDLSPEVVEMIMDKMQDINKIGTAYTSITYGAHKESPNNYTEPKYNYEKILTPILKDGLLGTSFGINPHRENWVKTIKNKRRGEVFFNIVGVPEGNEAELKKIKDSWYGFGCTGDGNDLILIFDLSFYEPDIPLIDRDMSERKFYEKHYKASKYKNRNFFYAYNYRVKEEHQVTSPPSKETARDFYERNKKSFHLKGYKQFDEKNYYLFLPPTSKEYGFNLSYRIPPRFFRGIIASNKTLSTEIIKIISLQKKIFKNKKELIIPIYDGEGNLYWPKNMSHEEVKKLAEEKNKKEKT